MRGVKFGRSTFGRVNPYGLNIDEAYDLLKSIHREFDLGTTTANPLEPVSLNNFEAVKTRLLQFITAHEFEHLVVHLLQLENRHQHWFHNGGVGDGGVDGLGFNKNLVPVGMLQCKLFSPNFSTKTFEAEYCDQDIKVYFASLHENNQYSNSEKYEYWYADKITELFVKHIKQLPIAISLNITSP